MRVLFSPAASRLASLCSVGVLLAAAAAPAHALFGDDEARKAILDLRQRVDALQNAQMQLVGQIEQLREQNAVLTGRLEELANDLTRQQQSSRDLFASLDARLAPLTSARVEIDGASFEASAEERRRYESALSLFSQGKYEDSATLLSSLVDDYPTTGYMPSALYWLGNALYAQNKLSAALGVQNRLIKEFPDHPRIADAQLSKAAALIGLGRKSQAQKTLQQVIKDYPNTSYAELAQKRLKTIGK